MRAHTQRHDKDGFCHPSGFTSGFSVRCLALILVGRNCGTARFTPPFNGRRGGIIGHCDSARDSALAGSRTTAFVATVSREGLPGMEKSVRCDYPSSFAPASSDPDVPRGTSDPSSPTHLRLADHTQLTASALQRHSPFLRAEPSL